MIIIDLKMSALDEIRKAVEKQGEGVQTLDLNKINIGEFTEDIKKYLEKLKKVKVLLLNDCQLTSIALLPNWKLTAVDLSSNKYIFLTQT